MTRQRSALIAIAGICLASVPLHAQGVARGGRGAIFVGTPAVQLLDAQPFSSQATIRNAPFTAEAVTEVTQMLADGNRIERRLSSAIARDSQGRTRREQEVALFGTLTPPQGEPPRLVTITDPVAGMHYTLDTNSRVAHRSRMAAKGRATLAYAARQMTAGGRVQWSQPLATQVFSDAVLLADAVTPDGVVSEQLGTRPIEGVTAEGTRTTMTIAAGRIGNIAPIEIVTERWFSKELQEAVLVTRRDPRSGETTYRLINIVRAEPPVDLFAVPPDYDVRDPAVVLKEKVEALTQETGRKGGRGR